MSSNVKKGVVESFLLRLIGKVIVRDRRGKEAAGMSEKIRSIRIIPLGVIAVLLGSPPMFAQQPGQTQYDGVLLDFTSEWCSWCRKVDPYVHQMEREGLPIRSVDANLHRDLVAKYQVTGLPCFILVVNGRVIDRKNGYQTEQTLRSMVSRIPLKSIAPPESINQTRMRQPSEANKTQPPQFPGHATQSSQPEPQLVTDPPEKKQPGQNRGFTIPFVGKTINQPRSDRNLQVRAKTDDLKLPKIERPGALASSVRICVKNRKNGSNLGSGTIISSEIGQTYILTCGHLFRDFDPETSIIDIDFFVSPKERHVTFVGKLVKFDLKSDVGLIAIPTDTPLPVAPLAGPAFQAKPRDSVLSIGCGGGEPPSEQHLAVTRINRYSGPHNIECTGVPEQGRSGGGLFSPNGEVIGVCTAADKQDQRGIYVGFQAIHRLLDQADLSHLYRGNGTDDPLYAKIQKSDSNGSLSDQIASGSSANLPEKRKLPDHIATLRESLGDLGGEEVVVRIAGGDRDEPRKMIILRDSALTSRTNPTSRSIQNRSKGARSLSDGDELDQNR